MNNFYATFEIFLQSSNSKNLINLSEKLALIISSIFWRYLFELSINPYLLRERFMVRLMLSGS